MISIAKRTSIPTTPYLAEMKLYSRGPRAPDTAKEKLCISLSSTASHIASRDGHIVRGMCRKAIAEKGNGVGWIDKATEISARNGTVKHMGVSAFCNGSRSQCSADGMATSLP